MLCHQHAASDPSAGAGVDGVNLTNRNVRGEDFSFQGTAFAGVIFRANGQLALKTDTGGEQTVIGEWLLQGDPAAHWLKWTDIGGKLVQASGVQGAWIQMSAELSYWVKISINGSINTTVQYEIATDALGATVIDTATHTYFAFVEGF